MAWCRSGACAPAELWAGMGDSAPPQLRPGSRPGLPHLPRAAPDVDGEKAGVEAFHENSVTACYARLRLSRSSTKDALPAPTRPRRALFQGPAGLVREPRAGKADDQVGLRLSEPLDREARRKQRLFLRGARTCAWRRSR